MGQAKCRARYNRKYTMVLVFIACCITGYVLSRPIVRALGVA
jgi:hypothetical protein